ncbi:MAG: PIN domain-containing protein [Chloroflexi bacterium CFX6]|nr:PIN domain-containing protein [Chloroflexi bacterium CFX6]
MTEMRADVFVDTNVLVYARDLAAGDKQRQAMAWMAALWQSGRGRLSIQVLNEFYHTVTRKLSPGMRPEAARQDAERLMQWDPLSIDSAVLRRAWHLQDRHALSFWDALIVAAAQAARCDILLTEDLQDGQTMDGLTVVSPFRRSPSLIDRP